MREAHILNVGQGCCVLLQHGSGRWTMFDICKGNLEKKEEKLFEAFAKTAAIKGNFRMCENPTNPIDYMTDKLGTRNIWRFILSHPDMDHMDGFDRLITEMNVSNFWDSGVRKEKPDFSSEFQKYKEVDWDKYESVRDKKESAITVVTPLAGSKGRYWNKNEEDKENIDFLHVYAPDKQLVNSANDGGDVNDASYVVCYRTSAGRILLPGDAHDNTWDYILKNHLADVKDCEFMVAPHHGRASDREWDFLDKIKPKFSVIGCADSEHLAYHAWNNRGLEKITQNQAGNIAVYAQGETLNVYIENESFVEKNGGDTTIKDRYGNTFYKSIEKAKT
jgi:beta-lactamase superfamily II metal-dependent hydrolase